MLALLWPRRCPRCAGEAERAREQFCEACWAGLRPLAPHEARWEIDGPGGGVSVTACAAFAVDGRFLDMLVASKYLSFRDVGRRLAREAARHAAPRIPDGALVPVPLRPDRRRERGFNQTEDFAAAIAAVTGRAVLTNVLVRRRGGKPLAGLARAQREAAVQGAFRAISAGGEEPMIVVDDVVTTGSTARACVAAMRAAGFTRIGVAAMGRAFAAREDAVPVDLSALTRF